MKHFGHDCDAFEDKRIQRLVTKHGLAGYGFYFVCLELIGQKIKKNSVNCELEYEAEDLAYKLRIDKVLAQDYLSTIIDLGLMWQDDRDGKVYCFKMLGRLEKNIGYNQEFRDWLTKFESSVLYKYYLSTNIVLKEAKIVRNGSVLNGSKQTFLNSPLTSTEKPTVAEPPKPQVKIEVSKSDRQAIIFKALDELYQLKSDPKYGSDQLIKIDKEIKQLEAELDAMGQGRSLKDAIDSMPNKPIYKQSEQDRKLELLKQVESLKKQEENCDVVF